MQLRSIGRPQALLELAERHTLAWQASPFLLSQVVEALCRVTGKRGRTKLSAVPHLFQRAIRPQQLDLALARFGNWQECPA